MPNISELYPSKYVKSSDLKGRDVTVVIADLQVEDLDDGKRKPILYFQNKEKGLVLNRTNADAISQFYGPNTDEWIGRELILFVMRVQGPNGMTDGIRVRRPPPRRADPGHQISSGGPNGPQVVKQQAPADPGFDDSIPF